MSKYTPCIVFTVKLPGNNLIKQFTTSHPVNKTKNNSHVYIDLKHTARY
jgi:hypothetical protein